MPGRGLASPAPVAESEAIDLLFFPVLDALLGVSAASFFRSDWQRSVRVFPTSSTLPRVAAANLDVRAVVASALQSGKLEILGAEGRPGPKPGEPGWPEGPDAASARVSRAQDFSPDLAGLCNRLTEEVSHRVSANLYVTPPRSQGLDRHQDGHDVLVLQVEGRKRWRIWRNDAPPPLDPLPALTFETARRIRSDYRGTPFGGRSVSDGEIEGRTEWDLELKPGDLIYVPRGWAHQVWTENSHSAHLTFGFHLVTWVDLLMTLVAQASRRHGEIRESLPIGFARLAPEPESVREHTRALLPLLDDIDGRDAMEEVIGRWLNRDLDRPTANPKVEVPSPLSDSLRLRRCAPTAFVSRGDSVGLFRSSDRPAELWLPSAFAPALRFVATVEPPEFSVGQVPGVSTSTRARLCGLLIAEGYVQPMESSSEGRG